MDNEQRNNLEFISQLTDVSKWDLAGLNQVTGYQDSDNQGLIELEKLAEDMESRTAICSTCGESADLDNTLKLIDSEWYCESCISKEIDRIDTLEEHLRSVDLDSISRDIEEQGYLNGRNYR